MNRSNVGSASIPGRMQPWGGCPNTVCLYSKIPYDTVRFGGHNKTGPALQSRFGSTKIKSSLKR